MNSEETVANASETTPFQVTSAPESGTETESVESKEHQNIGQIDTAVKSEETTMAVDKKTESSAITLSPGSAVLGNRPVGHDEFAVSGTMTFSGVRPIEASNLAVYDTLLGGRPIEASDLAVVDTDTMPGHRPIFASTLAVVDADTLPGHRPIAASPAYLMQDNPSLPNNRPIASNAPDAGAALMGYLD